MPNIVLRYVCEARPADGVGMREVVQSYLSKGQKKIKSLRMDKKNKVFNRKNQEARFSPDSD
jgi:hypothetical protein